MSVRVANEQKTPRTKPVRGLSIKNMDLLLSGLYRRLRNLTESTFAHGLVD